MKPHGIYPMMFAFFGRDGKLDEGAMRRQVRAAVTGGAHGIAALGLGSEVAKLSTRERDDFLGWVSDELAGRLPLAVTIVEPDVPHALAAARRARNFGAAWLVLQPPPGRVLKQEEQIAFYGAVADSAGLPVAIQNAPEYLPTFLDTDGILQLHRQHPNVSIIKAEGSALYVSRLIEAAGQGLSVFNGRGGLELVDNLRAGCVGMIPGMDSFDVQVRIHDALRAGDDATADRLYAQLLPHVVFMMQNITTFLCYGKRVAARRLGLGPVHDRAPALMPEAFGLAAMARHTAWMPDYPVDKS